MNQDKIVDDNSLRTRYRRADGSEYCIWKTLESNKSGLQDCKIAGEDKISTFARPVKGRDGKWKSNHKFNLIETTVKTRLCEITKQEDVYTEVEEDGETYMEWTGTRTVIVRPYMVNERIHTSIRDMSNGVIRAFTGKH